MSDAITMLFLISLAIPVISAINSLMPMSGIFKNADRFFKSKTLITLINIIYLRVALVTFLAFFTPNNDYVSSAFSMFSSIFMMGMVIAMPLFYLVQALLFRKELRNLRKKMEDLNVVGNKESMADN